MPESTPREPAHWKPRSELCVLCGKNPTKKGRREWCSTACQVMGTRDRLEFGEIVRAIICDGCGIDVDLFENPPPGRLRKRVDTRYCDLCLRHRMHRRADGGIIPPAVFRSLGTTCGICGEEVDLHLTRDGDPDRVASVDHITPGSLGGSDDAPNLQIAHFGCNQRKHLKPTPGKGRSATLPANRPKSTNRWRVLARRLKAEWPECAACAAPTWCIDHIHELADGGECFDLENLQPLCRRCHNRKTQDSYRDRYRPTG